MAPGDMNFLDRFTLSIRRALPRRALAPFLNAYHLGLALLGALLYGFPSRRLIVIGVTGTKGKSSTTEMISAIFEAADRRTAALNSIRRKVADISTPNTMRMSMPGRFYLQSFLAKAVRARCDAAIIEMTSEGARQHRHRAIALDALVFTNLAPEHIESHGSFAAYAQAKLEIGRQLVRSRKRPRIVVANADDPFGTRFITLPVEHPLPFSLAQTPHRSTAHGGTFRLGSTDVAVPQPGEFSLQNALAAATVCRAFGIPPDAIARGLASLSLIPGRAERIEEGQPFTVIVDYAHTPDSLEALYSSFPERKICVLGSTGGGRDTWKRPAMGAVADERCDEIILTNEDPYDEDPRAIIDALARGIRVHAPEVILDRRAAIARALSLARAGDAVLITGKGTDPTIQGPRGTSVPWSDAQVAREELRRLPTR